jgi:4-amino-4-deoxy-L-arabinose transferase-like glycosyltransferase
MEATDESAKDHDPNLPRYASGCGRTVGDLCYDTLSRYGFLFLLLLLALVLARILYGNHQQALWYDEIFSAIVATQPTWHRFAQAMPADGNPPLYALLTRFSIHLFGLTDLAVRLPSILSFLAALAGVYVFIRRECGVVFGLLAVVLTFSESGWTYSFEARPYALLLAFMVLALVSWQSATRAAGATPPRPRRLALAGIVVGIAGGILSHGIGIVEIGVPLLFGEAVRFYRTRHLDWPILATAFSAIPAMAIILPMMRRTHDLLLIYSLALMHPLTLARLHEYWINNPKLSLPLVLSPNLIRILVIVVFLTWKPRWLNLSRTDSPAHAEEDTPARPPSHIVAAALVAALLIPVTLLAMMFSTGYYNCRYGIGCIAGIAMLACLLLARRGRRQSTLCLSLILYCLYVFTHFFYIPERAYPIDPTLSADRSGLPIAIADPFAYLPNWWYAPPSMKSRIVYLADKPTALQYGYVVPESALMAEKPVLSAPLEDYNAFIATHDHFLIVIGGTVPSVTMKDRLENAGYRATLLRDYGNSQDYDMQRTAPPGKINPVKTYR